MVYFGGELHALCRCVVILVHGGVIVDNGDNELFQWLE